MKLRLLFFTFLSLIVIKTTTAQPCPIGVVDEAVWGTPDDFTLGFTIDSDPFDTDTIRIFQGQDTVIYMQYLLPKRQNITSPISGTAIVTSVQILSVAGLPLGLSWTTDRFPTNSYSPQTYRYGVVSLCGETFAAPGVRTLNVTAEGCGSLQGLSACDGLTFPLYLEILPGTGSGPIQISPPVSCDSASVSFNTTLSSPNTTLFPVSYSWLFHDAATATGKPVTKDYNAVGDYPVQMTVNIDEYYISQITIVASGGWFPDIEELTSVQNPELYLRVNAGSGVVQTPSAASGTNRTFNVDIPISDFTISVNAWDEDNGPPFGSADDNLGTGSVTFTSLSDGLILGYVATNGNFQGTIRINRRFSQAIVEWDTVRVLPPSVVNPITNDNGLTICAGNTTTLDVGTGFDFVQWYTIDNDAIIGENNQTLEVTQNGDYYAEVVETGSICPSYTDTVTVLVEVVQAPVINLDADGNLYVANPNGFDVQWFANSTAVPVPIPGGTNDTLTNFSVTNAPFSVRFTSSLGCTSLSSLFEFCAPGTSSADGTTLSLGNNIEFTHDGFDLTLGNDVAWAISTSAQGPITTQAQLDAAIAAGWVLPASSSTGIDMSCGDLPAGLQPGDYFLTPFTAEAVAIDPVFWNADVDSGFCDATFEVCIGLSGSNWEINPLTIILPNGDVIDVIAALAAGLVPPGTPITPTLWSLATSQLGDPACLNLIDIIGYYENPNGVWQIVIPNSGTGTLTFNIDAFNVVVDAANCPDLTEDQITPIPAISGVVPGGTTQILNLLVPPIPSSFPNIQTTCNVIGASTPFTVGTCGTSISDFETISNFVLYPNPNNGVFNISFEILERSDVTIQILDIAGRNIMQRSYASEVGKYNEQIELRNNLSAGFYILNLKVGNSRVQKHFIVE